MLDADLESGYHTLLTTVRHCLIDKKKSMFATLAWRYNRICGVSCSIKQLKYVFYNVIWHMLLRNTIHQTLHTLFLLKVMIDYEVSNVSFIYECLQTPDTRGILNIMQTAGTVRKKSLLSDCEVPNSDFLSWKMRILVSLDCIFIFVFQRWA